MKYFAISPKEENSSLVHISPMRCFSLVYMFEHSRQIRPKKYQTVLHFCGVWCWKKLQQRKHEIYSLFTWLVNCILVNRWEVFTLKYLNAIGLVGVVIYLSCCIPLTW